MKPSNFTMNSDYLSIAQTSSNEYTAYFGGGTLPGGGYIETGADFAIQAEKGAIDQIMISKDGGDFMVGSYERLEWSTSNPYRRIVGFLDVSRTSPSNLHARLILENVSPDSYSYPAMTFKIKVSSFKPPNVF